MKNNNVYLKLIPHYYRKWIYLLFLLPVTFLILKETEIINMMEHSSKALFSVLFFLPLMLVVFTAEKVEDERIEKIRMQAFGITCLFAFTYLLIMKIFDLLSTNENLENITANELVLQMIIFYLINKFIMLRKG